MKKTSKIFQIDGMTCSGCEKTIEKALKKQEGIIEVQVSVEKKEAAVTFDLDKTNLNTIKKTVQNAGYEVAGISDQSQGNKTNIKRDVLPILGITLVLMALYMLGHKTGILNFIPEVQQNMGYGILFVIGLLTSLHCVVMCGGINISQNLKAEEENPSLSPVSGNKGKFEVYRFKNSLLYNSGRVVSYTIIGGIIGAAGSVLSLTPGSKAAITIIAGALMAFIGLRMTGIFSFLHQVKLPLPKIFKDINFSGINKFGPFVVGLFNGLMPCAPLQGMQIYALSSGGFMQGALSMFVFSLGTFPLMFGLGGLVTFLSHKLKGTLVKTGAVLVIFLGLVMVTRGVALSGKSVLPPSAQKTAEIVNGVQIARSTFTSGQYAPISVQKGIPVRWIITIQGADINGCNGTMIIPAYNITKKLQPGENIVEFTPNQSGTIGYSCWMGMIRSSITITDGKAESSGSFNSKASNSQNAAVTDADIYVSKGTALSEEIKIQVTATGYVPRLIVLKRNTKVRFTFAANQLTSCNSTVVFPEYKGRLNLAQQNATPFLNLSQDFHIQCGMGMLNALVRVVDNPASLDKSALKQQAALIVSSGGGCCGSGVVN